MTAAAPSRLTILDIDTIPRHHRARVACQCGIVKWVLLQAVRAGRTKSCGCLAARRPIPLNPVLPVDPLDAHLAAATARAAAFGHSLGSFDTEQPMVAAVAFCVRCDELASVDLSEAPYLFGHAMDRRCAVAA